jgi:Rrf2 family protein
MRIGRTARHALLAAAHLAADPVPHTAGRLAREAGVPRAYLPKALQPLLRCGLLASQRGLHGGYTLACDPAATTALSVVRAVDPAPAARTRDDAVARLLDRAEAAAAAVLAATPLTALAAALACDQPRSTART